MKQIETVKQTHTKRLKRTFTSALALAGEFVDVERRPTRVHRIPAYIGENCIHGPSRTVLISHAFTARPRR